jgi:glutathione synthase/RimK-type ligase-like ATP-grasp enzyme
MIIVVGSPSEPPVSLLLDRASREGMEVLLLAEEEAHSWQLEVEVRGGVVGAWCGRHGARVDLSRATGLYLRLIGPDVAGLVPDPLRDRRQEAALAAMTAWADVAPLRVANRPRAMSSNTSKPYQAALIRALGFDVPETLVTSDPEEVRRFLRRHGRVVYKSVSGVRSVVHELAGERLDDLERVRHLPTQFQRLLTGTNVRVHVVGDRVHACAVDSETLDYRYPEGGRGTAMTPVELPDDLARRCVRLAEELDLPLAGVDLLHDEDGRWWCFEVNPSPAYSCFEEPTGMPIARSLATWLAGRDAA